MAITQKKRIHSKPTRRSVDYADVERYFNYTKKYVTTELYMEMQDLKDIDAIRDSIFRFFDYCIRKDNDLYFLKNMKDYDVIVKQFQKMVLDMRMVIDKESKDKKRITIKKLIEQEKGGAKYAKETERKTDKKQKMERFKRRGYQDKELLFLNNKLSNGTPPPEIAKQYENFLIRNNLELRSRNAIYKKLRVMKNANK
jgi:hypothetical protein